MNVAHQFLQLLDPATPDELRQRQHHRVGLGLESQCLPSFLDQRLRKVKSRAHMIYIISYACRRLKTLLFRIRRAGCTYLLLSPSDQLKDAPVTDTDSEKPRFLPILGYVLGFMALLGVLAFVVVALLHLFRR